MSSPPYKPTASLNSTKSLSPYRPVVFEEDKKLCGLTSPPKRASFGSFVFHSAVVVAPFSYAHSALYQFLQQVCKKEGKSVVLAGSAALNVQTRKHHGMDIEPNDVDFFTSANWTEAEVESLVTEFNNSQDRSFRLGLQKKMQLREFIQYKIGIHSIWNFSLSRRVGAGWYTPVQLFPQLICLKNSVYGGLILTISLMK
jgi:hypothetical protein